MKHHIDLENYSYLECFFSNEIRYIIHANIKTPPALLYAGGVNLFSVRTVSPYICLCYSIVKNPKPSATLYKP